ncbi:MAG: AAA family ATPase, partial [Myxococcales bacterium]|nr:AAA family ATPase [Myxococcales bacterium]
AEREAAARLRRLRASAPPWPRIDVARAIERAQEQLGVALSASQREAAGALVGAKLGVLTGGPGVGKTTLVRTLLAILREKDVRIELAAPTGRAARRLAEATGQPARTLHRLLEVDPARRESGGFKRGVDAPLECDLVVVDEASMLDVPLFAALLRALPPHAALLLVGDADQLPSVGPGRVLGDVVASGVAVCVELREIFRQAAESGIVRAAHAIHEGRVPAARAREGDARTPGAAGATGATDDDFYLVEANEPERAAELVLALVRERIPARFGLDPRRDVQVLVPMHRGPLGTQSLNRALQAALNPEAGGARRLEHGEVAFAPGDRVMQTENDYEKDVFNGDLGVVEDVDLEERALSVRFDGHAEPVHFARSELDALALAYAITVHKSQGSEYPAVVIALTTQHFKMLDRRLVYTAVTRGRKLVVVVGQRRALELAIERGGAEPRHTKLGEWLAAAP